MDQEQAVRLHEAAKLIEFDGVEAYQGVCSLYGETVANALIIDFLRRSLGSMRTFPPPENIVDDVNKILIREGILS